MLLDKLVMCDVSGLADKSDKIANFLTVSCKYGITCVYMSHTIYPTRHNWQMMMSQRKILIFFSWVCSDWFNPQNQKSSFANRYKNTYTPHRNIWINKLYFEISNSKEKQCLTIDTSDVNAFGPGKFRTRANNGTEQICYYNRTKQTQVLIHFQLPESKNLKLVR